MSVSAIASTTERVLVTGGAGFIGSHVVRELVRCKREVVVLDDLSGGFLENVPSEARFTQGSILDTELIEELFRKHRFTHVFHLAAYAAEGLSHFIKRFNYQNNLIGSVNLINASVNHRVRCFVFTSSIAVYGGARELVTEETPPHPEDPYGIAKAAVEQELFVTHAMFDLPYVIFRPHNVYGPGQNIGDRYRNVVGIFMNQILKGEPLTIFGDGTQTRAFSYISDVAPAIAQAAFDPAAHNQIFNIGSERPTSLNDLAKTVCRAMGVPFAPRYLERRSEVQHIGASHDKVRRVLAATANTELEEGVSKMAQWARQVGSRDCRHFDPLEVTRNLPPVWVRAGSD